MKIILEAFADSMRNQGFLVESVETGKMEFPDSAGLFRMDFEGLVFYAVVLRDKYREKFTVELQYAQDDSFHPMVLADMFPVTDSERGIVADALQDGVMCFRLAILWTNVDVWWKPRDNAILDINALPNTPVVSGSLDDCMLSVGHLIKNRAVPALRSISE